MEGETYGIIIMEWVLWTAVPQNAELLAPLPIGAEQNGVSATDISGGKCQNDKFYWFNQPNFSMLYIIRLNILSSTPNFLKKL